jgi:hypothetical protein
MGFSKAIRRSPVKRLTMTAALVAVATLLVAGQPTETVPGPETPAYAGPVTPWPRPIPVRLKPSGRDEILVTTLGIVETPLADGVFDPVADRVTTRDGRTLERYYKDTLEVPFYATLDKSRFPLPPSGWCSWYYYFKILTPEEVLANARWVARRLKPFGARYAQIDDAWQKDAVAAHNAARDWTTLDERFRTIGMDTIAAEIRKAGLEAGIWIAPHGQSDEGLVRRSGAFLLKPDGTSASNTWEGPFLLDPTAPEGHRYLGELFRRLRGWGYTYFKIDGQPTVVREYENAAKTQAFMRGPLPQGSPAEIAHQAYRDTLRTIREAIGPDSFLLSSWGTAVQGAGLFHASRTGGDIFQGRDGMMVGVDAVHRFNFLHNVVWYSDPDVLLVRPPLSDGTARAWASLFGLTGQALMASDRMTDLPESRVEMLRRVYPAVDIRPLDLYRPDNTFKTVVDLKVSHLGRSYDVVGVFNFDADHVLTRHLTWRELGLGPQTQYHVYDFWGGAYLGAWENGIFVDVPATDVRVLALVRAEPLPVLLSTSRHLTQGWVDLLSLETGGTAERPVLAGRSRLVGADPYRLTVGLPRAQPTFRLASARAQGEDGEPLPIAFESHQGYATASIRSETDQVVSWEMQFEPADPYVYPVESPSQIQVFTPRLSEALVRWPVEYHVKAGYRVEVDGEPVGVAFSQRALLRDLVPGRTYRIGVRSIWFDGSVDAKKAAEASHTPTAPESVFLSDIEPVSSLPDWRNLWRPFGRDRSVDGNPLRVAGQVYERGLGTHATWALHYDLAEAFETLTASVGIDDEVQPEKPVEAVFEVWGDGRQLFRTGPVRSGGAAVPIRVDVRGVKDLVLRTLPGGDGPTNDHTDWLEARVAGPRK